MDEDNRGDLLHSPYFWVGGALSVAFWVLTITEVLL